MKRTKNAADGLGKELETLPSRTAEKELRHQVEFDELVTTISTKFINLAHGQIDEGIHQALRAIGEFVGVDRSYLFMYSEDSCHMSNTHEWCAEGIEPAMNRLQNLPVESFPWFSEQMKRKEAVHVPRLADLPPEAELEKREWSIEAIQSLICVPTVCGGDLIGFLGFDSVRAEKAWTQEAIALLRIVGEIFANALERKRAEQALKEGEERFRAIADYTYHWENWFGPDGKLLWINPAVKRVIGYSAEECLAMRDYPLGLIHEDDRDMVSKVFQGAVVEHTSGSDFVFRLRHKDGSIIWGAVAWQPIYSSEGVCLGHRSSISEITDRKRAEEALRASERRFRSVVENAPDTIITADRDGTIRFINRTEPEFTVEQVTGTSVYDYVSPEHLEDYRQTVEQVFETGEPREIEHLAVTGSWYMSRFSIIAEAGAAPTLMIIATDVTERRAAAEALQASEARFRTTFEGGAIGISLTDMKGRLVESNPALQKILGYSGQELRTMVFSEFTHPEDVDRDIALFREMVDGKRDRYQMEKRYLHKDGHIVWVRLTVSMVRGPRGEPSFAISMVEDITERKQAEKRAEIERRFSESLIETAPALIVGLGADGKTTFMNQAMASATGYEREQVVGRDYASLFLPEDEVTKAKEVFGRLLAGQGPLYSENHVLTRDGRKLMVAWHGNCIYDERGEVSGLYGIGVDVTEQRMLEDQLRQAQKMESIGTLTSGIAHDFNNLLTVIMGNASFMLSRFGQESGMGRYLEDIEKAGERAASLIQQLLAFSRKSILQMGPMDLQRSVDETVALLRRSVDPRIEIRVRSHPALWTIRADRGQMNQVIMNFCVNARDAMPSAGTLKIETRNTVVDEAACRAHSQARPGEYVELIIEDTGTGMDKKTMARIFEPFFTTKRPGVGTGLGLSMVYGIVSQHGGWVTVKSKPGKGTKFQVFLPRSEAPEAEQPEEHRAELARGTEMILIVDDEPLIVGATGRILTECGYQIVSASNGEEAVRVFQDHHEGIDLILLDLALPKMSGMEVLSAVRKIDPAAKVVLYSGNIVQVLDSKKNPVAAGLPLLRKPLNAGSLTGTIRQVLDS